MQNSIFTEGLILLPTLGELYVTENNKVWMATNIDFHKSYSRNILKPYTQTEVVDKAVAFSHKIAKHGIYQGAFRSYCFGSTVFAFGCVLSGRCSAFSASGNIWDIAAGSALLKQAGGYLQWLDGSDFNHTLDNKYFRLESGDPKRWKLRQHLAAAMDQQEAIEFSKNIKLHC